MQAFARSFSLVFPQHLHFVSGANLFCGNNLAKAESADDTIKLLWEEISKLSKFENFKAD